MTRRILIAEDDPAILDVLRIALEDEGYVVEWTTDAATLRDLPNGYPDLFILDIWMPGWDGQDLCRALKSDAATRAIPVLLCSANRDGALIARAVGADGFLPKPFDLDTLLATVARHLDHAT